jgi:Holliday junction resolvasome RuvABC DNA-binding subunit
MTNEECLNTLDEFHNFGKRTAILIRDLQRQVQSLKNANKWHQEQAAKAQKDLQEIVSALKANGFTVYRNGERVTA